MTMLSAAYGIHMYVCMYRIDLQTAPALSLSDAICLPKISIIHNPQTRIKFYFLAR